MPMLVLVPGLVPWLLFFLGPKTQANCVYLRRPECTPPSKKMRTSCTKCLLSDKSAQLSSVLKVFAFLGHLGDVEKLRTSCTKCLFSKKHDVLQHSLFAADVLKLCLVLVPGLVPWPLFFLGPKTQSNCVYLRRPECTPPSKNAG